MSKLISVLLQEIHPCLLLLLTTVLQFHSVESKRTRESVDPLYVSTRRGILLNSTPRQSLNSELRSSHYIDSLEDYSDYRTKFSKPLSRRNSLRLSGAESQDPLFDPHADRSYQFQFDTSTYDRQESSDSQGNVRGRYSYLDADGITRTIVYKAGPGIGFVIESMDPPMAAFAAGVPPAATNFVSHPTRKRLRNRYNGRHPQQVSKYASVPVNNAITSSYQEHTQGSVSQPLASPLPSIGSPDTMSSYFSSPVTSYKIYANPQGGQVQVASRSPNTYNYSYNTDIGTPLAVIASRLARPVHSRIAYTNTAGNGIRRSVEVPKKSKDQESLTGELSVSSRSFLRGGGPLRSSSDKVPSAPPSTYPALSRISNQRLRDAESVSSTVDDTIALP